VIVQFHTNTHSKCNS